MADDYDGIPEDEAVQNVWLRVETYVWALFLLVQLSMIAFLLVIGRKDKAFQSAFFVLFVAVTVVDCMLVLMRVRRDDGSVETTIFGFEYPPGIASDIILHVILPVFQHAQPLVHTAIALNRFTAFSFPLKHAALWRPQRIIAVLVTLATLSTLLAVGNPVFFIIRENALCSAATKKRRREMYCDEVWAFGSFYLSDGLVGLNSAICSMLSFALNTGSVTALLVMRCTGKLQQKGPELRLFVHSVYMFVLQTLLAFFDLVNVVDNMDILMSSQEIEGFSWRHWHHSTDWLAGKATAIDVIDGDEYPTFGCKTAKDDYPGLRIPMCSAWYLILIGEYRIGDRLQVRTLAQHLYVLSGSIFLLIISANVRRAYFKFYFNYKCLQKPSRVGSLFTTRPVAASSTRGATSTRR